MPAGKGKPEANKPGAEGTKHTRGSGQEVRMDFWQHIGELRRRLLWAIGFVGAGAIAGFAFNSWIYEVMYYPLGQSMPDVELHFFAPTESFVVYMRLAFFAGLVIASPFVAYQIWAFIAPALRPSERRYILPAALSVSLLFLGGVAFVYFILLRTSLKFLLGFTYTNMEPMLGLNQYFSFVTALSISGGVLFQLPLAMAIAGWMGLITARWLWKQIGYALVTLMIIAAVITPTGDAYTMLVLTAPLVLLYVVGILIVWLIQLGRRKKKAL